MPETPPDAAGRSICAKKAISPPRRPAPRASSFTAGCAIWSISSFVWFARRSSSAKSCGESRPISSGRFASCCPTTPISGPPGCFGSAFFSTITWAAAACCRPPGPCGWRDDPAGEPLKPQYTLGFEYSDCWAEDARLVVLNARDAADKGAVIAPRTRCISGTRDGDLWTLTLRDERSGQTSRIRARALVNAAGPWVSEVLQSALHIPTPAAVRLVKGSHIVVGRLFRHDRCYILQNKDRRVFFVMPFERDYTLIGTTDLDYRGDLDAVRVSAEEIAYLCDAASSYFRTPVTADQVLWSYSGVRPLYDDGASEAQEATRDYVLKLDPAERRAAASQHLRRQDHHLPAPGRGGAGDPVAPAASGAQARGLDGSRRLCPAAIFRPTASNRW